MSSAGRTHDVVQNVITWRIALPGLAFAAAGCVAAGALVNREPASAASNLPNRLVVAQLAADSSGGGQPPPRTSSTPPPTRTPTPSPTPPEVIPEPVPTYMPTDPYYPYPY